jgi:DNA-binding NtrC family response regulator
LGVIQDPPSSAASARRPDREILVVDADEALCARLKDALESDLRFRVTTASTSRAAHAALQENGIDLVLVDGRLPGTPGTSAVAAHADKLRIPVIVMASDPSRIRPQRGAVRGLLAKPIRMADLALLVDAALAVARRRAGQLPGFTGPNPATRH